MENFKGSNNSNTLAFRQRVLSRRWARFNREIENAIGEGMPVILCVIGFILVHNILHYVGL